MADRLPQPRDQARRHPARGSSGQRRRRLRAQHRPHRRGVRDGEARVTNALAGLGVSYADRSPLLLITSSPPQREVEANALQGFIDQTRDRHASLRNGRTGDRADGDPAAGRTRGAHRAHRRARARAARPPRRRAVPPGSSGRPAATGRAPALLPRPSTRSRRRGRRAAAERAAARGDRGWRPARHRPELGARRVRRTGGDAAVPPGHDRRGDASRPPEQRLVRPRAGRAHRRGPRPGRRAPGRRPVRLLPRRTSATTRSRSTPLWCRSTSTAPTSPDPPGRRRHRRRRDAHAAGAHRGVGARRRQRRAGERLLSPPPVSTPGRPRSPTSPSTSRAGFTPTTGYGQRYEHSTPAPRSSSTVTDRRVGHDVDGRGEPRGAPSAAATWAAWAPRRASRSGRRSPSLRGAWCC